jgi:tRNA-splicing ligase RtcB
MPIKQSLHKGLVPVHIFTDDIEHDRFDLEQQTAGIECRKDGGVVDEIPAAYKDIDVVMAHQSDLVEVVHTLRQVICIKG